MSPVIWMVAGALASWPVAALSVGGSMTEIGAGMAAPLVVAVGSWMLIERAFRRDPARVTALMYQSLLVKMLLFGAYVVIGVQVWSLKPVPFVVSFAAYFVMFHMVEAAWLRRLFATSAVAST
jgi:hypothetical protein